MFKKSIFAIIALLTIVCVTFYRPSNKQLPVVAIANYGPHASLDAALAGFKEQMQESGFVDNKTIHYKVADVGFDPSLIPQMLVSLKARNPKVILLMSTPVAQVGKGKIHDIPLIYTAITDPIEAGLIKEKNKADFNITGSSDMQDLRELLKFAQSLLPKARRVGLLYATSESNDIALVNMMKISASALKMEVIAIPVEQARDVPIRMQEFKDKVDLIYVGSSGPIQPTLPAIAAEARKMKIPVFNMESQAVKDGLALASFGVNYKIVGRNAGKLAAMILQGHEISNLPPIYPTASDHYSVVNKKLATEFNVNIPSNIEIVE